MMRKRGHFRHGLRLYYGAHLHRRLFWWFGLAIFLTTASVNMLISVLGPAWSERPWRGLVFVGVPAVILWIASGKVARRIARPLYDLVQVSQDIGRGNLKARARIGPWDIGETAILSRSVNDMAARIERQLADQRELLAGVSHELRTPLARLRVLVELARTRGADGNTMDDIEREAVEIDTLVGELLASARLDFQALSVRPLDAIESGRRAIERAGLPAETLEVATTPDLAKFSGDPTLVARALANLLDNAHKHGRGVQRLRVDARPGFVVFQVEDAGPGFASGEEQRVFASFYRGGEALRDGDGADGGARPETSLGLGLALVARIARAHGGGVRAENRPDGGARLTLELATQ